MHSCIWSSRYSTDSCCNGTLQETALKSESQLESTRRSLIELDEDKQAGKEEAESARFAHIRKLCCGHNPVVASMICASSAVVFPETHTMVENLFTLLQLCADPEWSIQDGHLI